MNLSAFPATLAAGAVELWRTDGAATLQTVLAWVAKILLGAAPAISLLCSLKRFRFSLVLLLVLWIPVLLVQAVFGLRACPDAGQWIALILLSGGGAVLVRYRWCRLAIALPSIVLLIVPGLQHGNDLIWHGQRLMERCATNDGKRPTNLTDSMVVPDYFGVEPFPDGSWLLTAHQGSSNTAIGGLPWSDTWASTSAAWRDDRPQAGTWWLRHRPGEFEFDQRVGMAPGGHYWLTCQVGDELFVPVAADCIYGISREAGPMGARIRKICVAGGLLNDQEFGIACDPGSGTVFLKSASDHHLLELDAKTGEIRRHREAFSGIGGTMRRRAADGRLIVATVPYLNVYAPDRQSIEHRTASGIAPMGIDICQADGAAAVTDFAGRLRVFSEDADGGYQFEWGLSLFAPRSVAFSPDCAYIAVTSGNDRDVWLIDRAARKVAATYAVGPSVRKVTFVSAREFAVVDACTVTSFTF